MAQRTCTIDGCGGAHRARGWCTKHYKRWQAHGDPLQGRIVYTCSAHACSGQTRVRGFCRRHRWVAMYAERKAFIDLVKLQRGCIDCGFDRSSVALQFDHRDPHTKGGSGEGMASNLGRGWAWILAEIAKCDVRCANCHAIRTHAQGRYTAGR